MNTLCSHCGFQNPPGMRFCGNCGTRLGEAATTTVQPASAPVGITTENLGIMMGADLLERLHKAGLEAAGQRRNVTVLFTDLTGYTSLSERLDSEVIFDVVQNYIRLLINCVYKYEGTVDKLTGDGLMALFGAPIMHENNAERAVLAAIDMQAEVSQLSQQMKGQLGIDLRMRVGLHSGLVVVGGVGSNMLMNYTAIGDTVNLSHRIEEAAPPGSILVSESVYRQTNPIFDYAQVTVLNPKGIAHPVLAYRVLGPKINPGRVRGIEGLRAPMIGRDTEIQRLKSALSNLTDHHQGQLVLVTGEAGLGKSRLTHEFKTSIGQSMARVLEGQSLAYRRSISYWLFLDLLYNYLQVKSGTAELQVRRRLTECVTNALGSRASEVLPYLEYLLSLPPSNPAAAERIRYLEASQLRQQIFLSIRNLFIAESQITPLVIILEDLHWADDAALDLLRYLAESLNQAPILILAISRQVIEGAMTKMVSWAEHNLATNFHQIQLQSLSLDQSERLLEQLLSIPDLPERLREQILQRAAGIPFYLEEILRMLIDAKAIQRVDDHWQLVPGTDISTLGVPDTLQELILTRFDRLERFQRRILQVAAVIGKNFSLPVLQEVLQPDEADQAFTTLITLEDRDFVMLQSSGVETEYTFRHVLMSDAIYSTLLRRERSKLHGQVGEAIETLYADRIDSQVELLANHYRWSTRPDRALHYLILAGEKAYRSYATAQARQHYDAAIELIAQVEHTCEQELQLHMGFGDVLVLVGEYPQARSEYEAALQSTLSGVEVDIVHCSILERKIGTTYGFQGEYDAALIHLAKALEILKENKTDLPVENALIFNEIGWIDFRRGNLSDAQANLTRALNLLEATNQYDVLASIYNRLGGIFYQKGQFDLASHYVRRSLVLRQEIGDIVAVARSYNNLGLLAWKKGDWDNALEDFERSLDLRANLGDAEGIIEVDSNLGLLLLDRGEIEEARGHFQKALAKAELIGHSYLAGIIYLHFSRLYVLSEDYQAALEFGKRSLEALTGIGALDDLINVYTYLGLSYLGLSDIAQAEAWAQKAMELSTQLKDSRAIAPDENWGWIFRLFGEIAFRKKNYEEAEKWYKQSSTMFESIGAQIEQGRSAVALARLAIARGEHAIARIHSNEARLIFKQLGAHLDQRKLETVSSGYKKQNP